MHRMYLNNKYSWVIPPVGHMFVASIAIFSEQNPGATSVDRVPDVICNFIFILKHASLFANARSKEDLTNGASCRMRCIRSHSN